MRAAWMFLVSVGSSTDFVQPAAKSRGRTVRARALAKGRDVRRVLARVDGEETRVLIVMKSSRELGA